VNARANPARPSPGALLARVTDVPQDGAAVFDFAEGDARYSLILARRGENVFAYENRCPHANSPMERPDGRVAMQAGQFLICSAHAASFDVESGQCVGGPAIGRTLIRVQISVADGEVRMAPKE
jgi:nitrite reductase/ring-hydroxylating ferredoxin subunit